MLAEAKMQIDIARLAPQAHESGPGGAILLWQNAQIEIAERAHARLRISPGDGPSFHQHRLDPEAAHVRNHLFQVTLVERRFERLEAISLLELLQSVREAAPG